MRLIDADALKEAMEKVYPLATNEMGGVANKCIYDIIDNAQTVPLPDFKDGYKQAIKDGKTNELTEEQAIDKLHETGWLPRHDKEMTERPKGEWVHDSDHSITIDMYKCSVCSGYGHTHFNFCPTCGAKMKGGAE